MNLGEPLAVGRTAEVYSWEDGWILKLFHTWVSEESVRYEERINRVVHASGLAVPQVGEVIEFEGRLGLTYERLAGKTMGEIMASKPWMLFQFARELAKLHAAIHAIEAPADIPSQRERLADKIRAAVMLEPTLKSSVLERLSDMPLVNQLCHGDFHPWNVMVGNHTRIIDWVDATSGAPLADVARTTIILEGAQHMVESITQVEKVLVSWFHRIYLKEYFALRSADKDEYYRWLPLVAAGRMSENIPGLDTWLRKQVVKGLDI